MVTRVRLPSDRGIKTTCSMCKAEFVAVWEKPDGTLSFYFCLKCDVSDYKEKAK